MKTKNFVTNFLVFFLLMMLSGCAGLSTKALDPVDASCTNASTNAMLKSGDYQKKINNFLVIQDGSTTMSDEKGKTFNYGSSKLDVSKELVQCLNSTLPDSFDANAGMRVFGPVQGAKGLVYGMVKYSKEGLGNAVNSLAKTGGVSPIANAIASGSSDLNKMTGNAAVIIVSDGLNTEVADPASAATAMKEMYGDNVCIYTVLIGNDLKGKATMDQIAAAGKCGFATDVETIGKAQGMNQFVMDIFLEKAPRKAVKAQPVVKKTVVKKPVEKKPAEKISITLNFEFDFDKAEVRSDHHDDAKRLADALNKYSDADVELEGHADSIGTEDYNMALSRRRAESVKKYLVEKFSIKASRVSTVGYGTSKPVASNDTDAGRQKNRRVVANIEAMTDK